jgi:hypothetical protein
MKAPIRTGEGADPDGIDPLKEEPWRTIDEQFRDDPSVKPPATASRGFGAFKALPSSFSRMHSICS